MLRRAILPLSLLAAISGPVTAASYFVVVPVPGKSGDLDKIDVILSPQVLPNALAGIPYGTFDSNGLLLVTGDPHFNPSLVSWSVSSGALPAGMTLTREGKLSGTPATAGNNSFTLRALYKTRTGQGTYSVSVHDLLVNLASASLPGGKHGQPYSFDFSTKLDIQGDEGYDGSGVTWSIVGGQHEGLTLNQATGVLSGTPVGGTEGTALTVQATYKTKSGRAVYTLVVATIPVVLAPQNWGPGGLPLAFRYEDETVANSCKQYRDGKTGYGKATASGYYWVNMGSGVERVYCDQESQGGGWTLVARSGGAVVNSTFACNGGLSGANTPFGWSVARGSAVDTGNPYSMGVFSRNLQFTEVLFGSASGTSNSWGTYVYKQTLPANFKTALARTEDVSPNPAFGMARRMGHTTDTTQYYFRDAPEGIRDQKPSFGLHADGWQTCYGFGETSDSSQGNGASYGGAINYRHGLLMVR